MNIKIAGIVSVLCAIPSLCLSGSIAELNGAAEMGERARNAASLSESRDLAASPIDGNATSKPTLVFANYQGNENNPQIFARGNSDNWSRARAEEGKTVPPPSSAPSADKRGALETLGWGLAVPIVAPFGLMLGGAKAGAEIGWGSGEYKVGSIIGEIIGAIIGGVGGFLVGIVVGVISGVVEIGTSIGKMFHGKF